MRWYAVVIGLTIMGVVACGGDEGTESAEDAFRRQVAYLGKGQFSRAYDEIHPAQQAVISRETYVRCAGRTSFEVGAIRIVETYAEPVTLSGTTTTITATAITAEVELKSGSQSTKSTDTYHEFLVDGTWRFSVSDASRYADC